MSERGVFAVDRGVWDHPMFTSRDAFSKREAWMWLISDAAWKPRRKRIAGIGVELVRGQVAHSLRHLAETWGWSVKRVRGFLGALQDDAMIITAADTGITIITVCKYNEYQRVSLPKGTDSDTQAHTQTDTPSHTRRAHEGHNIEDIKNIEGKKDSDAIASGAEAPVDHRKRLFDEGLPKIAAMTGKGPDACRSFVGKCLKAASDDAIVVLGLIEDAERNRVVDPTAWIVARLKPKENPNERRTVHAAARDLSARVRALDQPAPGLCDGTGGGPVRLISSG